jgi:ribosomal protein S18 acetylase RimI-like enzyme
MPAFTLRRLSVDDTAAFRDIRLEGLRLYPSAFGADYEDERVQPDAWFRARVADHAVFGAFLDDGSLAGVAGLIVPAGTKMKHKGTLWGMYVRPAARGTGLAAALVLQVIDYAKALVEELTLHVSPDNAAAIRLYEAAGFSVYATEPRALKIDGVYFDSLLMTRRFQAFNLPMYPTHMPPSSNAS